jgi:hemerythrin
MRTVLGRRFTVRSTLHAEIIGESMAKFVWKDEYSTGIPEIDRQHVLLVDLINRVIEAHHQGLPRAKQTALVNNMVDHAIFHFGFEERLQEHAGYPFLKAHQKSHVQFAKRIAEFQSRFNSGEDVVKYIDGLLVEWLTDHFMHDDADYVGPVKEFLAQHPNFIAENMQSKKGLLGRLFA